MRPPFILSNQRPPGKVIPETSKGRGFNCRTLFSRIREALALDVTRTAYPASQTTMPMGLGHFVIEAEVTPSLGTGEQLIFMGNGEPADAALSSPTLQLTNVFSGAYRSQLLRVSEAAKGQSKPADHTVNIIRPTENR